MKQLVVITLLFTTTLFGSFKVGQELPPIELFNQFKQLITLEKEDRLLIMAFEKELSVMINNYLKKEPKSFLDTHHAKYISDISTMPSFITSMFVLPKMKKYPFSVMLIKNDFGKQFNRTKGKITLYRLKNNKIEEILFLSPKEFRAFFEAHEQI